MAMRRAMSGRDEARFVWGATAAMLLVGAMGLGCIIGSPDGGDDDDGGIFDPFPSPQDDDQWMEDVEERREERDDPTSVNYRGDFGITLTGEVAATLDGQGLGEATFELVREDLVGTPPHCQITLADREPDARGAQGYLIVQYIGDAGCDVPLGTHEIFSRWEDAEAAGGGYVIKTVQVDLETDTSVASFDYRGSEGSIEVVRVDRGELIQAAITGRMGRLTRDDGEEGGGALRVEGSFGAVARP